MSEKQPPSRKAQIVTVILFIVLAALYVVYGVDPLGLFTPPTPTPTVAQVAPPTVAAAPDWWEVYFTDPTTINDPANLGGSIEEKLIEQINNAQSSIHIAVFEFNLTPVAEALIAAYQRGVDVRWVTDDEHGIEADEEENRGQFAMLEDAGIEVRDDQRGALMHNKIWIFDGQVVWTGSTNITQNGIFRNNNNVLVLRSTRLAGVFEREFEELWGGAFGPSSPSTVGEQFVSVNGTPVQVLFAPEDEVVSRLLPFVEGAQQSIRFMAFSFTHDDLGAAILERAQNGVDVKGIFETRGSETEYSELPRMYCANLSVRQDGNPRTFHHKVIVIDERIVVTGSLNFSNSANESNDENVVIITNPAIAAEYLAEFDRRWAEASAPDPADMGCTQ